MISKNFYLLVVYRVLLISSSALGMGYFFYKGQYIWCVLLFLILIAQTVFLIRIVNHTNRKIAYFFESLRNEDFTIRFPEEGEIAPLRELNERMNMLNGMIQKTHLSNKTQEQYYQEIIKQADIGIMTINDKGHILISNPTVEKLLNHRPLNHIKQLLQVDESLYDLFSQLRPFDRKLFQLTNERERTQLAIKAKAISLNKQDLLLVVIQDIHQELDEKETDSWVRLIRVLTHEIMNTITPITSISESILRYFSSDDKVTLDESKIKNTAKGLQVIKEQGTDLMEFVQSYRTLLNVPAPDKSIIHVKKLLEKVQVLMSQNLAKNNVNFEVFCDPESLEIYGDEKQLIQVLLNLGKNAIQALSHHENGKIIITAGTGQNGSNFIEVRDNGPGISPDMIDEVFVPFFTTKKEGTGIGLSLSKQVLQLHGGSLKVRSTPNEETAFVLNF